MGWVLCIHMMLWGRMNDVGSLVPAQVRDPALQVMVESGIYAAIFSLLLHKRAVEGIAT